MKIIVMTVGKTRDASLRSAMERYLGRIARYAPFEYVELAEVKRGGRMSEELQKGAECKAIMARIAPGDRVVLMDERGRELSSREFAASIGDAMGSLPRNLIYVIGGPYGFSPEMYARANGMIALSRMTLTHEMARLVLVEQVYRAMTILRGEPYHHD